MTRRPLLWLSALGAVVAAVVVVPTAAGGQSVFWNITIETDAVALDHEIDIAGDAEVRGGGIGLVVAETVTVTITQREDLPPACGEDTITRTVEVVDGRYAAPISVPCNGPYRIGVVANGTIGDSGDPAERDIGVAATPLPPAKPFSSPLGNGIRVTWPATPYPDALGWILITKAGNFYFSADQTSADLGPEVRGSTLGMRAVHWGDEGPDGPRAVSDVGPFHLDTTTSDTNDSDPDDSDDTDDTAPPTPPAGGPGATVPSSSTNPPTTSGPTRGTGSPQPLPDGFSETLPFGTRPESFVPGSSPATEPSDDVEQATGQPAPAGLVRTTQKTSPGLVAPFALAVMMLTVAAHIAWYLRRSRPGGGRPGGGQVRPI